jgi:ABC-2 type transport system permease protein
MFAVAGAIVSRQEDLQSTTAPMSLLLMAAYFLSIALVDDPESTVARVVTFLPPVAPMIVPSRAAQDALAGWELAASVAAMLAGIALVFVVATRIYRRAVLRIGAPLKLTQALRLATPAGR